MYQWPQDFKKYVLIGGDFLRSIRYQSFFTFFPPDVSFCPGEMLSGSWQVTEMFGTIHAVGNLQSGKTTECSSEVWNLKTVFPMLPKKTTQLDVSQVTACSLRHHQGWFPESGFQSDYQWIISNQINSLNLCWREMMKKGEMQKYRAKCNSTFLKCLSQVKQAHGRANRKTRHTWI